MSSPVPTTRTFEPAPAGEGSGSSLLGKQVLGTWVPTAVADSGKEREVLRAQPVDGHANVLVRLPDDIPAREALDRLEQARVVRGQGLLPLLTHDMMGDKRLCVVTPATGATTLASRLATRPLNVQETVRVAAGIARGLARMHASGHPYRVLTPEHVLVCAGPHGQDEICLLPLWWIWRHGFDASHATPWVLPADREPPGRAADAWSLGALIWHALTGMPPIGDEPVDGPIEMPLVSTHSKRGVPAELDTLVAELMHADPQERLTDADVIAERLETLSHQFEGGGPGIAPPMLLNTPVPVGGQLRQRSLVLPVPPPPRTHEEPPSRVVAPTPPTAPAIDLTGASSRGSLGTLATGPTTIARLHASTLDVETPVPPVAPSPSRASEASDDPESDESDIETVTDRTLEPSLADEISPVDIPLPKDLVKEKGRSWLLPALASAGLVGVAVLLVLYLTGVL